MFLVQVRLNVHDILVASWRTNLTTLASIADKLMEIQAPHMAVNTHGNIATPADTKPERPPEVPWMDACQFLSLQVAKLTQKLEAMDVRETRREQPRWRSRSRARSSSIGRNTGYCYYHQRFGAHTDARSRVHGGETLVKTTSQHRRRKINCMLHSPEDSSTKGNVAPSNFSIYAADGTPIPTFGETTLWTSGLRRPFTWEFTVAKVQQPIIGADFLQHHGLLVDLKNKRIIDDCTNIYRVGEISTTSKHPIINHDNRKQRTRQIQHIAETIHRRD
ncbi:uncharacterized protein LOC122534878 [Frieseomelitta varia]|uniref:uncharacterized protein LOC122534878 n=1 Tax=Frieseomelitta varia TaxID=561572 RepID=UPI001CB69BE2|nr:uncharacterized protein LOC122534878 [Frieseomelitta varia]